MKTTFKNVVKYALTGAGIVGLMSSVAFAETTVTFLIGNDPNTIKIADALEAAYETANPDINIDIEIRPAGAEGDNIVKTRLATGEMEDVFLYNTGSLLMALRPEQTLMDLSKEPFIDNVIDSFKMTVTNDSGVYGVPWSTAMGGGLFYHKPTYEKLGLEVPKTWADFMANNAVIAKAGMVPVAQTYGSTWTSQLLILADYYNIQAALPNFATDYTNNKIKYATTPVALRGFEKLQEIYEAGYLNKDFGAATYEEGLAMIANGDVAHYPMLTFALGTIGTEYPDKINDIGFFAQPGEDAEKNGMTTWMPQAAYVPKTSEVADEAKKFVAFIATTEACDIQSAAAGATGPFLIKGCSLPDSVPPAVIDMVKYFEQENGTAPALEFLSPIKGPSLEQITVEVGSGIRNAVEGAELYDRDVKKQAVQLGLENW